MFPLYTSFYCPWFLLKWFMNSGMEDAPPNDSLVIYSWLCIITFASNPFTSTSSFPFSLRIFLLSLSIVQVCSTRRNKQQWKTALYLSRRRPSEHCIYSSFLLPWFSGYACFLFLAMYLSIPWSPFYLVPLQMDLFSIPFHPVRSLRSLSILLSSLFYHESLPSGCDSFHR